MGQSSPAPPPLRPDPQLANELPSWRRVAQLRALEELLRAALDAGDTSVQDVVRTVHDEVEACRGALRGDRVSRALPHVAALVLAQEEGLPERVEDWLTHLAHGESPRWARSRAGRWERLRGRRLLWAAERQHRGGERLLLVDRGGSDERAVLALVSHEVLLEDGSRVALAVEAVVAVGQDGDAGELDGLTLAEAETVLGVWDPEGEGPLRTGRGAREAGLLLHRT